MLQQKLHIRVVPIDERIMYRRWLEISLVAETFGDNKMMIIIRLVILINIRAYLFFVRVFTLDFCRLALACWLNQLSREFSHHKQSADLRVM